jgi:predicted O-methyltransferase YrrM
MIPSLGGWAISPDFAALVVSTILHKQPDRILELGSGVSTLFNAYAVQLLGRGKVLTLDHDATFLAQTQAHLNHHDLAEWVTCIHAPLQPLILKEESWEWYNLPLEVVSPQSLQTIDLVIVDGPPGMSNPYARYPALPLLWPYLSSQATILVDDADRPGEQAILWQWLQEHPQLTCDYYPCEKGAVALSRTVSVVDP